MRTGLVSPRLQSPFYWEFTGPWQKILFSKYWLLFLSCPWMSDGLFFEFLRASCISSSPWCHVQWVRTSHFSHCHLITSAADPKFLNWGKWETGNHGSWRYFSSRVLGHLFFLFLIPIDLVLNFCIHINFTMPNTPAKAVPSGHTGNTLSWFRVFSKYFKIPFSIFQLQKHLLENHNVPFLELFWQ